MDFSSWVCGRLTGGLGNRLFQHAAAAGLAEKWSVPLVFCPDECTTFSQGPYDNIFKLFPSVPLVSSNPQVMRLPEPAGHVFTYTPFPERPPSPFTSVNGWRQTELYFPSSGLDPNFKLLVSDARCTELLNHYELTSTDQKLQSWFIHIRLGDYKVLPHHQIDMANYYTKAVTYIPTNARVFLCCDELPEFGGTLERFFQTLGLSVIPLSLQDEIETLFVMSQCWGGAVVANSTFSWWGAYFAKRSHPEPSLYKAVYPGKWGNGLPKATDVVPQWGIRILNE